MDVVALVVSVVSLVMAGLSWRAAHNANVIAAQAPVNALDQELRNQIVTVLIQARQDLSNAMAKVGRARDVADVSASLREADEVMERHESRYLGGRVRMRLMVTRGLIDLARTPWDDLVSAQNDVVRTRAALDMQRVDDPTRVSEAEAELRDAQRRQDATGRALLTAAGKAVEVIDVELENLRREERSVAGTE